MPFDLLIRNGIVIDGSGRPARQSDVGVKDGRVTKMGRIHEPANVVVDAEGHVVSPGFVDGHTHMDAQVMWDRLGTCSCYHGVTTVVMGNCGFTLAPSRLDERDLVVRNLERAEDIAPDALALGIDWSWETFPQYLDAVERQAKAINYAAYVGHSALRTWAMGERAFDEAASEDDLGVMEQALVEALRAGAVGFSTSRSEQHETSDDRPVASRAATWEEVRRLVARMGSLGRGVFEVARAGAADPTFEDSGAGGSNNRASQQHWLQRIAVESRVPVTFGSIRPDGTAMVDSIVKAGGRAFGQTHSRGVSSVMSFRTRLPFDALPEWKAVRTRPLAEQRKLLADPDVRARLVHAAHYGQYPRSIGAEARRPDFQTMLLFDNPLPPHFSVAETARQEGVDPVELILDRALDSDFHQLFVQQFVPTDPSDLLLAMKHPRTVMTFSDAGAHVSQISDCSIQTYLLGHWVRERQAFTWEEAIRMLTQAPARAWGFLDRGLVRESYIADLNVFDPALVAPDLPTIGTDLPAGATRLVQRASGFLATIVGGRITMDRGRSTGEMPGRVLRI